MSGSFLIGVLGSWRKVGVVELLLIFNFWVLGRENENQRDGKGVGEKVGIFIMDGIINIWWKSNV
jgi:hypothetical protein